MKPFTIRVLGTPASQGSKRGFVRNNRVVMVEMDKKIKPWRQNVHEAAQAANVDNIRIDTPVKVEVTFLFARPKSHYRTGRNAHLLRDGAPFYVTRPPDVDKLSRALLDPLTEVGVWNDDSQVVVIWASKRYCVGDELPGAIVEIIPLPVSH